MWTLNFKEQVASLEKYGKYHHLHWLWKKAVENPNELHTWEFDENGQHYIKKALYDPETKLMHTNLAGCPSRAGHHVGMLCSVCGNDERGI
jgi:hypothetical protein